MNGVMAASYLRDANRVPITTDGLISTDSQTLTGNNTTVAVPIFGISGTIEVRGLWGVVTTALGANNTANYFRLNDQTSQVNITLNTGVTTSALGAGSLIIKKGLAAAAAVAIDNAAGRINEPTTLETNYLGAFLMTDKLNAVTNIEYVYTTTDTPTSGAIQFFLRWLPLSMDAAVLSL